MVTALLLEVVGEDAPLNEIAETERRALEERRTSPRYARYRFLRGFKVSLRGVVYGLEWVTVRLPVLYRGEGEEWRSCSWRRGWCSGPSSCPCWEGS